jgi:hypothetical protein
MMGCGRLGLVGRGNRGRGCSLLLRSGLGLARRRLCRCLDCALEKADRQNAEDAAHTGQGEQLVADENGRLVLVFVQSILSPIAQELLHGVFRLAML